MIALWLIAAHLTGDFVLQTRYQAVLKLTRARVRALHVTTYLIPFIPLAAWETRSWRLTLGFLAVTWALHYLVDSRRYRSTLGDLISWRWDLHQDFQACQAEWFRHLTQEAPVGSSVRSIDLTGPGVRYPPPNPWAPLPIVIDQTLHLLALAATGAIFLA